MQLAHTSDLVVEMDKKNNPQKQADPWPLALCGPLIHHLSHGGTGCDGINEGAVTEGIGNVSCGLVPIDACHRSLSGFDDVGVGALVHNGLVLCLESGQQGLVVPRSSSLPRTMGKCSGKWAADMVAKSVFFVCFLPSPLSRQ